MKINNKIIFIANNNVGTGLSGGDRIFLELARYWSKNDNITIFASQETVVLLKRYKIGDVKTIVTTRTANQSNNLSVYQLLTHVISRSIIGVYHIFLNIKLIRQANYVYSVSDFYPDLIPALFCKLINPKIKWIAGYYLLAAPPYSKEFPYHHNQTLKGTLYWLMQLPSRFICNLWADIIFITSQPDTLAFPHKRTVVVRGGVDISQVKPQGKIKKVYDCLFIGRFHPQKGILELIDIWRLVVDKMPSAQLAIVGNGPLEGQARSMISKLKLENNVKMFGFLEGKPKYRVFQQSKVVVHPAVYDSGGMAAAEAMAWGLPGVSFDLESLKTYYPQGILKTKCFDLKHFAKNIISLLTDEFMYHQLSIKAKQLIIEEWNWRTRSLQIYDQALEQ